MNVDLKVPFCGLELASPIIAASGTFGYGIEFADIVDLNALGAVCTKGLSREPMPGNAPPRMVETASGMLNAIGLQNVGVDDFVTRILPDLRKATNTRIFANVFGFAIEDYMAVIERLETADGIAAYELNVSCPNTRHGGMVFGNDPHLLEEIVSRIRKMVSRPLIVKLSPNVGNIAAMARVAVDAGADALSVANTFVAMEIDVETRRTRLRNGTGGLSGPAIKPIVLHMVWEVSRAVPVPVLGLGGVANGTDAIEYMMAGATAVQVGTANYADPRATENVLRGLKAWCVKHGVMQAAALTGTLQPFG